MDIAIIGAGGAGMTAAWLLQDTHAVTLYEEQARMGGHAQTIVVEQDGGDHAIDAGFEFFGEALFPTFNRLLRLLSVPVNRYWGTLTVYSGGHSDGRSENRATLLPPFRNGRIVWSALSPRALGDMLALRSFLAEAARLVDAADPFVTLEEFLAGVRLSPAFRDDFLYPFLLAQWCVELEDFRQFSAYNVLKYTVVFTREGGLRGPRVSEVAGGIGRYAEALGGALERTALRLPVRIRSVTRAGMRYRVEETSGRVAEFDHLVIATSAAEAAALLEDIAEAEPARRILGRVEYFPTVIAVHGDRRLMPAREAHWSVVNTRWDGRHSQNTIWKPWRTGTPGRRPSGKPVFRSWITFDARPPEPLYAQLTYAHGKINRAYFQAQADLRALQGQHNLWFAGVYTHDIDCHESAIVSAVRIAERLAPEGANLRRLLGPGLA